MAEAEQKRRLADRTSVQLIGWIACLMLSISLVYVFVRSMVNGPDEVDPWFMALQVTASILFFLYALRLKNKVFITANLVAIASAAGTLVLMVVKK